MKPSVQFMIERFCRIQALAVLIVAALARPLQINSEDLFNRLEALLPDSLLGPVYTATLPMLCNVHEVLILKEGLIAMSVWLLTAVWLAVRFVWRPFRPSEWRWIGVVLAVLVALAVSALFQSPTPWYSFKTLTRVASVGIYGLVVADMARRDDLLRRGAILILAIAGALTVVALLQHVGWTLGFLPASEGHRNRMGSLIGHNTGLSIYLLMAAGIALSFLYASRRGRTKLWLAVGLGFFGLVLLLAQSRSAWAIALVLVAPLLIGLRRLTGWGPGLKRAALAAAVAALLIGSQFVNNPLNVLRVMEYPLARRLADLTPATLRTETRLRTLRCSLPLIAQSPLVGHGLGSFQYVYPEAQRDYYLNNPFMWITPTDKRTQRAHNDYLQWLVETGLIGLALGGYWLFAAVRRGRRRQARALTVAPLDEAHRYGVAFALLAFAMQGLLDFPFHIAPLVVTAAFLFAVWHSTPAPDDDDALPPPRPFFRRRIGSLALSGLLLLLGIVGGAAAWRFHTRELMADFYNASAQSNYRLVADNASNPDGRPLRASDKYRVLNESDQYGHLPAIQLEPRHSEYLFLRGLTQKAIADLIPATIDELEKSQAADAAPRIQSLQTERPQRYALAADLARQSLREYRNHRAYALIGDAYNKLYPLSRNTEHLNAAIENLEVAVGYSPAYAPVLYQLSELYTKLGRHPERIIELRSMVARYHWRYYEDKFLEYLFGAVSEGEMDRALGAARSLLEVAEFNADHDSRYASHAKRMRGFYIQALIFRGDYETAAQELQTSRERYPDSRRWDKVEAHLLCAQKQYAEAATVIDRLVAGGADDPEHLFWEIARDMLAVRTGRASATEAVAPWLQRAPQEPTIYEYMAQVANEFFGDKAAALGYLEQREAIATPPLSAPVADRLRELRQAVEPLGAGDAAEPNEATQNP